MKTFCNKHTLSDNKAHLHKCKMTGYKDLKSNILDVNLWRQQLQAGVGKHPGIVEGSGAMFGQVLLPQVAGEADDPGVLALSNVGEHPNVRRAHHIKLVADGR